TRAVTAVAATGAAAETLASRCPTSGTGTPGPGVRVPARAAVRVTVPARLRGGSTGRRPGRTGRTTVARAIRVACGCRTARLDSPMDRLASRTARSSSRTAPGCYRTARRSFPMARGSCRTAEGFHPATRGPLVWTPGAARASGPVAAAVSAEALRTVRLAVLEA